MKNEIKKTNVMRILEAHKINYIPYEYDTKETNGEKVAKLLGKNADTVFKTLVTVANTNEHYVFVVPVASTLDLKKSAKAVGVKKIEMIKQKELLPLTGYIHGGCSPIGMKKAFITIVDDSCCNFETITFSAGKIGSQVEVSPVDLQKLISCKFDNII